MQKVNEPVHVIGAGLAGCEAAWQLAQRGVSVILYEKRPLKSDAAHKTDKFAELVCSNSLRAGNIENAVKKGRLNRTRHIKPINLQSLCAAIRCARAI